MAKDGGTELTTLKIAVFAPMPSANVKTVTAANRVSKKT